MVIFLDLTKAYDCLNMELLLKKYLIWIIETKLLELVGIGNFSNQKTLNNEIARSSVLGQLLFAIFINDLYFQADQPVYIGTSFCRVFLHFIL